jgi:acetate kinase
VIVLCINSGSSSLKAALYEVAGGERRIASGQVDRIGLEEASLRVIGTGGEMLAESRQPVATPGDALRLLLGALPSLGLPHADAVGHRLVHGGPDYFEPVLINPGVVADLKSLRRFAPLHLPAAIAAIEALAESAPGLRQVACFDTAFHARLPEIAREFPLPRRFTDGGVRRYGFHGLSYESIVDSLLNGADPKTARGRWILLHLGNGASIAAVRDGRSIDTTMGLTPLGGLMMGTRTGDLDPGLVLHLLLESGRPVSELDHLLNHDSGLLGVSGLSRDMRTLLEASRSNVAAAEAVDMFCYIARKHLGAMAAVLGGVDLITFSGGIGENAVPVREKICSGLGYLGAELDRDRNERSAPVISRDRSACTIRVVRTEEERIIARHTARACV